MRRVMSIAAAEQQQRRQDRELDAAHALVAALAVVPGEHDRDRQADEQDDGRNLLQLLRPPEGVAHVGDALQQSPGPRRVGDAPLHHLAAAQLLQQPCVLPIHRCCPSGS